MTLQEVHLPGQLIIDNQPDPLRKVRELTQFQNSVWDLVIRVKHAEFDTQAKPQSLELISVVKGILELINTPGEHTRSFHNQFPTQSPIENSENHTPEIEIVPPIIALHAIASIINNWQKHQIEPIELAKVSSDSSRARYSATIHNVVTLLMDITPNPHVQGPKYNLDPTSSDDVFFSFAVQVTGQPESKIKTKNKPKSVRKFRPPTKKEQKGLNRVFESIIIEKPDPSK